MLDGDARPLLDRVAAGNGRMYAIAAALVAAALGWYFLVPAKEEKGPESISGASPVTGATTASPENDSGPFSDPAVPDAKSARGATRS